MRNNIFLEQSRGDKSSVEQSIPHKSVFRSVGTVTVILLVLSVLVTACSKPEKEEIIGTWRWISTTGGIAGVHLTPETEGFETEFVFKGSTFSFYKDGKKVTSGAYRVDDFEEYEYEDEMPHPDLLLYTSIHFSETQCKKIAEATDYTINLLPSNLRARLCICGNYQELSLDHANMYDGFIYNFVKK